MGSIGIHGSGGSGGTPSDPSEVNVIEYGSTATSLGQKAMAASIPIVVASDQSAVPVSGTVTANAGTNLNTSALALETTQTAQMSRADTFKTRADTFTATGNGVTVDASAAPVSAFGIQVQATGAVTSWDVRLEGSLNNSTFTTILTHTNVTGDGVVLWSGSLEAPTLYFRARAAGLVLGGGTNIVVTILGQN